MSRIKLKLYALYCVCKNVYESKHCKMAILRVTRKVYK